MKANRFVTCGVALVTVLLMVGGLASQVLIVAEAFDTGITQHAVPVIEKAMAGGEGTAQTRDRIMVLGCRDHPTPHTSTAKANS